jgi:hypothetical protein
LYNNNTGSQYYNSGSVGTLSAATGAAALNNANSVYSTSSGLASYNPNEFKDKDTTLTKDIRHDCLKMYQTLVNTKVKKI